MNWKKTVELRSIPTHRDETAMNGAPGQRLVFGFFAEGGELGVEELGGEGTG